CLFLMIWMVSTLNAPSFIYAADEEACSVCHKYAGLARIDTQTGKTRLFYVSEDIYINTVHGKVLCRNCHLNLDVIPHTDAKKVDCSTKCHVKEPSTDKEFSHGGIYAEFNTSIHGMNTPGMTKKSTEDLPRCSGCHVNPVYQPVSDLTTMQAGISQDALRRCLGCHENKEWTNRFYQHFAHRMHRSKTAVQTVALCLECHKDEKKMARHGLLATSNYKDTFHWKGVLYGDQNMPDCLSCHAPVGYTVHSMKIGTDPASSVYKNNLQKTCSNVEGTQICHPKATEQFATGKIHPSGSGFEKQVTAYVAGEATLADMESLRYERRFRDLSGITDEDADLSTMDEKELFQRKVYMIVKYVYTLLITVVIGGMLVHQVFDFMRILINKSRNNHLG
ncbi:MAG: hypothetical protein MUO63_11595, partial [Desulfobulbaceae bacterium]|nr:hypothetical protein [Desulfobulbaceae bacterium]